MVRDSTGHENKQQVHPPLDHNFGSRTQQVVWIRNETRDWLRLGSEEWGVCAVGRVSVRGRRREPHRGPWGRITGYRV